MQYKLNIKLCSNNIDLKFDLIFFLRLIYNNKGKENITLSISRTNIINRVSNIVRFVKILDELNFSVKIKPYTIEPFRQTDSHNITPIFFRDIDFTYGNN